MTAVLDRFGDPKNDLKVTLKMISKWPARALLITGKIYFINTKLTPCKEVAPTDSFFGPNQAFLLSQIESYRAKHFGFPGQWWSLPWDQNWDLNWDQKWDPNWEQKWDPNETKIDFWPKSCD